MICPSHKGRRGFRAEASSLLVLAEDLLMGQPQPGVMEVWGGISGTQEYPVYLMSRIPQNKWIKGREGGRMTHNLWADSLAG